MLQVYVQCNIQHAYLHSLYIALCIDLITYDVMPVHSMQDNYYRVSKKLIIDLLWDQYRYTYKLYR